MLGREYIKAGEIRLSNLATGQMASINSSIVNINVEYSMTMASQLQFTVIDFNDEMTKRNYFEIGRDVIYTTQTACLINGETRLGGNPTSPTYVNLLFEIAQVDISQGPGNNPQIEVSCYSKAIQQMKRDRKPGEIKGSGSEYVKRAARKYGLRCFVEKSSKKVTINKASGDSQAESLWDVLSGLASEAKFMLFEADGILFFASQKFLLNKWGSRPESVSKKGKRGTQSKSIIERYIPLYNRQTGAQSVKQGVRSISGPLEIIDYPSFSISANDPLDMTGSFSLNRANGTRLRPGMTIKFFDFPGGLDDSYLVDSVSFQDRSPDPVQVSFRKPEKKPKEIKDIKIGKIYNQRSLVNPASNNKVLNIELVKNKNRKSNRPNSQADLTKKYMFLSSADLPQSTLGDPRVFPLPTILNQQLYPRYDSISYSGQNKLLATGNIDMYSRPTKLVDGKITTLAQLIVENVTEPGFNSGNPYVAIVPRVYVDESGEPQVYSEASASTSFITAMSTNSSADFVAKMADLESAQDYVKLINHQQVLVLSSRFRTENLPETSIYPLPTNIDQQNYPYMSTLISAGNIDLYSLPAGKRNGRVTTLEVSAYSDSAGLKLYPLIWSVGGTGKLLTRKEALNRAEQNNSYFAILEKNDNDAEIYFYLLKEQQELIINERFGTDFSSLGDL